MKISTKTSILLLVIMTSLCLFGCGNNFRTESSQTEVQGTNQRKGPNPVLEEIARSDPGQTGASTSSYLSQLTDSEKEVADKYYANYGQSAIAHLLKDYPADYDEEVEESVIRIFDYLISKGARVNTRIDGITPKDDYKPYDISPPNKWGNTPLHIAEEYNNINIIKFLVANGADVNAIGRFGNTPLYNAAINGHIEIVKYLVSQGADVNARNKAQLLCPVGIAIWKANFEIAEFLVSKGAILETRPSFNSLRSSSKALDNAEVIRKINLLVSLGGDVNAKDNNVGFTALHAEVQRGGRSVEIFKCLISHGADVNAKDYQNDTPLHHAVKWNDNVEVIRFLVSQGADVNAKNNEGYSPLSAAKIYKTTKAIEYLESIGAK